MGAVRRDPGPRSPPPHRLSRSDREEGRRRPPTAASTGGTGHRGRLEEEREERRDTTGLHLNGELTSANQGEGLQGTWKKEVST